MAHRQATWREHYFGMPQADTSIPKFAVIAQQEFKNLLGKALKLEISSQRGDWEIPEIAITDGRPVPAGQAAAEQVEEAVRQLQQAGIPDPQEELPAPEEEDHATAGDLPDDEHEPPLPPEPETPVETGPLPEGSAPKVFPVGRGNTPDQGEILLGGGPTPSNRPAPAPERDPWAPPPKPTHKIVKTGATIQFGSGGKGKVLDE